MIISLLIAASVTSLSAKIIDGESARHTSDDPTTLEARIAEASGYGFACEKDTGSLNLVQFNGHIVLIGTAHGFYDDDGTKSCHDDFGIFHPDDQYNNQAAIDHSRGYAFDLTPLNETSLLRTRAPANSGEKGFDLAIFRILDLEALHRYNGEPRMIKSLMAMPSDDLIEISNSSQVFILGGRDNYFNFSRSGFEQGCSIEAATGLNSVFRHDCDTGGGSSGATLDIMKDGTLYSLGMHYGAYQTSPSIWENYFISAQEIARQLGSLFPADL